jgi:chromosomal replication initiator protein
MEPEVGARTQSTVAPSTSNAARFTAAKAPAVGPVSAPGSGSPQGTGPELGPDSEGAAEIAAVWAELQAALRKRIRHEQFETWFRRVELRQASPAGVRFAAQNSFARDWLLNNYKTALEQSVLAVCGAAWPLVVEIDPELTVAARTSASASVAAQADEPTRELTPAPGRRASQGPEPTERGSAGRAEVERENVERGGRGRSEDSGATHNGLAWESDVALNPHYRFDGFVVGPCNRFAHAAAVGVSESPGRAYNPFFLHGSVGLGKTHLLQSLCYALLDETPDTRILYLSCETFVNHFVGALETGNLSKFRNKYRNVDVLVVDDIHMLANKERTQEEFFHTFNTLYNAGKQIVLSSDSPPKEIPTLQERLVSRFKWGLVTEIEAPCYETRMAILKRKSREKGHELPDGVAKLVAEHIDTNIRELEGAVTRLISYAGLNGQEITPELARKVLRDVFAAPRGQPSMDDILRIITAHFNIKVTELQSRRRTKAIAYPRQVGMYLARKITRHSLEEIGGFFGGRDHTTVLYAVEQIEKQIQADERLRATVVGFLAQLQR